jgi:hypothetical protein
MAWLGKLKIESRKLIVLIVSVAAYLANALTGKHLDDATMLTVLGLVGAWMLSQGLADMGQQGAALAAARATAKQGGDVAAAVQAAVSRAPVAPCYPEDGPTWGETSAMDPEDAATAPGPLHG